ncbi:Phospholipid hydroperoxide glutathione peroxidase, mitochondrial [Homalodisca vitripennis]|nr:Phospholipid hydroperoxide glutathione peroxidase, mitochondrial [Homalodisca vitripennis]
MVEGDVISLSVPVINVLYRGHPLIIVNVASECGLTATNYKELAELYEKYKDTKGKRPDSSDDDSSTSFQMIQSVSDMEKQKLLETGSSEDIVCFALNRNANFDLFEKVKVNGEEAHPLWKYLKHKQGSKFGDGIKWNFTKFVVDKNGQPVDRFAPTTPPHIPLSSPPFKNLCSLHSSTIIPAHCITDFSSLYNF